MRIPELELEVITEPNFSFSTILFLIALGFSFLKIVIGITKKEFILSFLVDIPGSLSGGFFIAVFLYSSYKLIWRVILWVRELKTKLQPNASE